MLHLWMQEIESLEAVAQDEGTRSLCLRMAAMSQAGTLAPFVDQLRDDEDIDEATRGSIVEIASDEGFLLALADYVRRTRIVH